MFSIAGPPRGGGGERRVHSVFLGLYQRFN